MNTFQNTFPIFPFYRHRLPLVVEDVNLQNTLFPANDRERKIHTYKKVHKCCQLEEKNQLGFTTKLNTNETLFKYYLNNFN